eukprot:358229-Chlamydomonas_euryale.AAC.8
MPPLPLRRFAGSISLLPAGTKAKGDLRVGRNFSLGGSCCRRGTSGEGSGALQRVLRGGLRAGPCGSVEGWTCSPARRAKAARGASLGFGFGRCHEEGGGARGCQDTVFPRLAVSPRGCAPSRRRVRDSPRVELVRPHSVETSGARAARAGGFGGEAAAAALDAVILRCQLVYRRYGACGRRRDLRGAVTGRGSSRSDSGTGELS